MTDLERRLVLDALADKGVMRSRDLASLGVSAAYVKELADRGYLDRVGRGLYSLPGLPCVDNPSLSQFAAYAPYGPAQRPVGGDPDGYTRAEDVGARTARRPRVPEDI